MNHDTRQLLLNLIHSFTPTKILVVGDLILDKYTWGEVERISPEAPIPVVKVSNQEYRLGGSASVATNLATLNCEVEVLGWTGKDESGRALKALLKKEKISYKHLLELDFTTIVKDRILTNQQQLLRVDYEGDHALTSDIEPLLLPKITEALQGASAVVISDYAKGVLSPKVTAEIISQAQALKIPIICDPGKGIPLNQYKGVTTLKPNRMETELATGIKITDLPSLLKAASIVKKETEAEFLSISLDKEGILYYRSPENYQIIGTQSLEVFDVTGAGDMVISIIAAFLSAGIDPIDTLHMANVASAIEISHMGVVPIEWREIQNFLTHDNLHEKIPSFEVIKEERKEIKTDLIFTNGYFDNLSAGHLRFILEIGKISGRLVVAINSDESIQKAKGEKPLLNQTDRARLLASLENVWRVVIFDAPDASQLITELKPQIIVKGESFKDQKISESDAITAVGAKVEYLSHFQY